MILQNVVKKTVYYQLETSNKSFRDMHFFLKNKGIKKNAFFLQLNDPDLAGIDPYDPNLNAFMKRKILRECMTNYWYFVRECVRIPDQGGTGHGKRYELHRGNLAMSFCVSLNLSIFFELSRQLGKTLSVLIRLLWEFNFGTQNSEMIFLHKKHEGAKDNLRDFKIYRSALPSYLQMEDSWDNRTGKKVKAKNSIVALEHVSNGNRIKALASASSRSQGMGLGRGMTVPRIYFDEYAFAKYNREIYLAAAPAYKTASENAKKNHAPYGIILTTTPGDLTTEEGLEAYNKKDLATPFSESWYDYSADEINDLLSKNTSSMFVYIRFTYKQVGKSEQWLKEQIVQMEKDYSAIKREILLEWSHANLNSPFSQQDLDVVKTKLKNPLFTIQLRHYYNLEVYERFPSARVVPIIGVDVSGGFKRDASAITVINSETTHVMACLNCNFISIIDLSYVIIELVTKYLPNAVVNVERNGGFGASVLARLIKSRIKRNVYYEIKDKVIEERYNGKSMSKQTKKTKIYGTDNTHNVRELLMETLRERMELHKDKFISPIIYHELETLEVKKNGRIEHSTTGHDDQIFSYLMALHVWYYGVGLKERWGINKTSLKTDEDLEEAIDDEEYDTSYQDLTKEMEVIEEDEKSQAQVKQQLDYLKTDTAMLNYEWEAKSKQKDDEALKAVLRTKLGREAYNKKYNCDSSEIMGDNNFVELPNELFNDFYK